MAERKGVTMTIHLEVPNEQPLSIAEAIIERETSHIKEEYTIIIARENIRQIGQALLNYVASCERADAWFERVSGKE